jgi:hypothetical protein
MSSCPRTGLTVPECSCGRCLEAMLRRVQPELPGVEIRVPRSPGAGERRHAARRNA